MVFTKMRVTCLLALLLFTGLVWAQADQAYECAPAVIEESDAAHLSTAEKIALMEEAFYEAVDAHEDCLRQMSSAGGGGGGAGSGLGMGAGDGVGGEGAEGDAQLAGESSESEMLSETQEVDNPLANGKANEKLDGTSNDCIIKQQLLEKASAEPDPQRKRKLIAAYKSYQC
jgi:hypothetical protein